MNKQDSATIAALKEWCVARKQHNQDVADDFVPFVSAAELIAKTAFAIKVLRGFAAELEKTYGIEVAKE